MTRLLTFLCLLALALTGCKGFGMKSIPPKHPQYGAMELRNIDAEIAASNDTNFYHWPKQTIELPRLARVALQEDDCGACQAYPALVNPAVLRRYTYLFSRQENFLRAEAEVSVDLVHWERRAVYHNDYIRTGDFELSFEAAEPVLFHRLKVVVWP